MALYRSSEKFDSMDFFSYQQKGLRCLFASLTKPSAINKLPIKPIYLYLPYE